MGTPLKNPPVYFTLAQVRFNTVLKLADFMTEIQDHFRKKKYPGFDKKIFNEIQFITQNEHPPVTQHVPVETFHFENSKKTHVFILDNQSLTLQSTNYGHFESFSADFLTGLQIVHEAVTLAYTERIGLRYLDRIIPEGADDIKDYLQKPVHGLGEDFKNKNSSTSIYSYTEDRYKIEENIHLPSRMAIQNSGLLFPPDLRMVDMEVSERFISYKGINAILDNDGFFEKREDFSLEMVKYQLIKIHQIISSAFQAAVTEHARNVWNK